MKEHGGPVPGEHLRFSGAVAEKRMTRKALSAKPSSLNLNKRSQRGFPAWRQQALCFRMIL